MIEDVQKNKLLGSVTMPRQWSNQDNVNTWATHHGKTQGEVYNQWGFSRYLPKGNGLRPLLNSSKKGNSKSTREGMAGVKTRTPPSRAHQIYEEVPAKICHTLF